MKDFNNLIDVAKELKNSKKKVTLLYAFNGTGKTRLSMKFKDLVNETIFDEDGNEELKKHIIYYNAFTEDLFYWDNDLENDLDRKLKINTNSTFISLVENQGKENEIATKFKNLTLSKIEPEINTRTGEITFSLPTGDSGFVENIKISKGEESIFIWCVFYVLMESIIFELNIDEEERSTNQFDEIKYIFIDDPISSLDDNRAIDMALELNSLIRNSKNDKLRFFISTHHALFYNILHTKFEKANKFLFTKEDDIYYLDEVGKYESPFGYHLLLKTEIQNAIKENRVKRYHFNLMRNLFEKTAYFLGYTKWSELIDVLMEPEEDGEVYIKRINFYSHSNHSILEARELEPQEKQLLIRLFNKFLDIYNWKVENE